MGQVQHPQGWRRARTLGLLGATGIAAFAIAYGLPNKASSFGLADPPCSEVVANCQVGDLNNSVLALGSNGSTIFASDNFSPSSTGDATSFCFWALYNTNVAGTDNIVISFYADTVGSTTVAGYPVGPALATYATADLSVTRAATGQVFAGLDVYEYHVDYTGATPHSVTSGQCEWIEISNAVAPADAWFIMCSEPGVGLGDDRSMQRGATVAWGFQDVTTGSDLAICMNTGINSPPAACAIPASCGTGGPCSTEGGGAGCSDPECCTLVCITEPLCCAAPWDSTCVDIAINGVACAAAPYTCSGGGPANDCATSPTTVVPDAGPVAFDLTTANTDGATINPQCTSGTTSDVWFITEATADGLLTVSTCGSDVGADLVVTVYDVGDGTYSGQDILDEISFIQCDDDGCCPASFGCPSLTTVVVNSGTKYLIRVGMFVNTAPTSGFLDVTLEATHYIWNTGPVAAGLLNGAATQLGFSSGNLGGTSPERWQLAPFTLPALPAGSTEWNIYELSAQGFDGVTTNETLNYIVWSRSGINETDGPAVDGEQLVTGMATYPTPVGDDYTIDVDFDLPPGDYWMTIYADNTTPPSNFAWFGNAQNGPDSLAVLADDAGGAFGGDNGPMLWRAFCVTAPSFAACGANPHGFAPYRAANWTVDAGQDPNLLYTQSFRMQGLPAVVEPSCAQDIVTSATFLPPPDGIVDGADLAILIGNWSFGAACAPNCLGDTVTSATFLPPPDGIVDGADLAVLIGAWGNPGCP